MKILIAFIASSLFFVSCQSTRPLTTADPVDVSSYKSSESTLKRVPEVPAATEEEILSKIEQKEVLPQMGSTTFPQVTKPIPSSIPPINSTGKTIDQNSFLE